jgi:hypothetical protein
LIVNDLSWGESPRSSDVELTTPPKVLRRALGRDYGSASSRLAVEHRNAQDAQAGEAECRLVMSTCKEVLEALDLEDFGPE